ncbi:hypothetical protein FJV76_08290 [Mesorhizobium sp. WSM4303]|uniref:hypothetical protein n=1 Tax=unclassified Mesorhizobium TaxID=325217 RepID=UPI00115D361C|nr:MULTISPECIES: hypothetical protein [unclassified Mesorhizobium]TRC96448.1 hypothetical protein FJV77_13370 [Mesorhizobium sp. WSM4306]TRD06332.1 hypothetical protein FJV76_08290 [Mesorhizobium sp. WSM4303]
MSIIALNSQAARSNWFVAVTDWLRQARVAINLPRQDVEDLSDRQLRDIGAKRKDVTRAVDRELGRLGLLDIGWQRNRR